MIASWYQPAQWSVGQQWLLLLLSGSLLAGGVAMGLLPRWKKCQQLMSDTQSLWQPIVAEPPTALSMPPQRVISAAPIGPEAALTLLFQQISQLTEQNNLTLLRLQGPAMAYSEGSSPTQLTVEIVGEYQSLLDLLLILRSTPHPWAMDTLLLQREEPIDKIKLTLGLLLTEATVDP